MAVIPVCSHGVIISRRGCRFRRFLQVVEEALPALPSSGFHQTCSLKRGHQIVLLLSSLTQWTSLTRSWTVSLGFKALRISVNFRENSSSDCVHLLASSKKLLLGEHRRIIPTTVLLVLSTSMIRLRRLSLESKIKTWCLSGKTPRLPASVFQLPAEFYRSVRVFRSSWWPLLLASEASVTRLRRFVPGSQPGSNLPAHFGTIRRRLDVSLATFSFRLPQN